MFKKAFSIILAAVMIMSMGAQAFAVEVDNNSDIPNEEIRDIGYSITDENGINRYYINGKQILTRAKESEYEGYKVVHDSWKEYDWDSDKPLSGHSSTSMEHKDTGDYRYHYTRVTIDNLVGQSSDSERVWTYGFMAKAHTKGIKYSDINILRSGWGVED